MLLTSERNGDLHESNIGLLWLSIRVASRGSLSRRNCRARSISPSNVNGLTNLGGFSGFWTASTVAGGLDVIFRILRGRNGILEELEEFSEILSTTVVILRILICAREVSVVFREDDSGD